MGLVRVSFWNGHGYLSVEMCRGCIVCCARMALASCCGVNLAPGEEEGCRGCRGRRGCRVFRAFGMRIATQVRRSNCCSGR
jgi:hypothetical protein